MIDNPFWNLHDEMENYNIFSKPSEIIEVIENMEVTQEQLDSGLYAAVRYRKPNWLIYMLVGAGANIHAFTGEWKNEGTERETIWDMLVEDNPPAQRILERKHIKDETSPG